MTRGRLLVAALIVAAAVARYAAGQEADSSASSATQGMTQAELEDEITRREEDLARYGERLRQIETETEAVRADLDRQQATLSGQESHVRARVVTLCRLRQGGYLHLLRGASSVADLIRRARFARALAQSDLTSLRQHQSQVEQLERRRAALQGRLETAERLRQRIADYRDELAAERERRRQTPLPGQHGSLPISHELPPAPWIHS